MDSQISNVRFEEFDSVDCRPRATYNKTRSNHLTVHEYITKLKLLQSNISHVLIKGKRIIWYADMGKKNTLVTP